MIWIRADANGEIGSGHIMRCITIARALRQCGQQVCFITADDSGTPILKDKGEEYRVLHTDYRRMEDEIPGLRSIFEGGRQEFFLVDSYYVTRRYLGEIREKVPVGILDDKGLTGMPVDLLINYNIFADASLYGAGGAGNAGGRYPDNAGGAGNAGGRHPDNAGGAGKYLLGTDYVPLRDEFEGVAYPVREKAETVLITTGGSDKYNIAGKLLKKALADPCAAAFRYLVVSGAYNVHLPELRELEGAHENVRVCCNVSNMSELMRASDIAVSAGGSTMYELSAVGVPLICFSFADNQERIIRYFADRSLTCFGGDYLRQGEAMLDEAVRNINRLAADPGLRRSLSRRLRAMVDGRGAMRIAEELCAGIGMEDGSASRGRTEVKR